MMYSLRSTCPYASVSRERRPTSQLLHQSVTTPTPQGQSRVHQFSSAYQTCSNSFQRQPAPHYDTRNSSYSAIFSATKYCPKGQSLGTRSTSCSSQINKVSSMAPSLERKATCFLHRYVNEFFCLTCKRDICSHCVFMSGPHTGHHTIPIKDYLQQLQLKHQQYATLSQQIVEKYATNKIDSASVKKERHKEISEVIDSKIEYSILKLKELKADIKTKYKGIVDENVVKVGREQQGLVDKAGKNRPLDYLIDKSVKTGDVREILQYGKSIDQAMLTLQTAMGKYDSVKQQCYEKRQAYKSAVKGRTSSLCQEISLQIKYMRDAVDIPKFKVTIKPSSKAPTEARHHPRQQQHAIGERIRALDKTSPKRYKLKKRSQIEGLSKEKGRLNDTSDHNSQENIITEQVKQIDKGGDDDTNNKGGTRQFGREVSNCLATKSTMATSNPVLSL